MCLQSVDKLLMETPSDVRPVLFLHDRLIWPRGLFSTLSGHLFWQVASLLLTEVKC